MVFFSDNVVPTDQDPLRNVVRKELLDDGRWSGQADERGLWQPIRQSAALCKAFAARS